MFLTNNGSMSNRGGCHEKDYATKMAIMSAILGEEVLSVLRDWRDLDAVPATRTFVDERNVSWPARRAAKWDGADVIAGDTGASMDHVLLALLARFPNANEEESAEQKMETVRQGTQKVGPYLHAQRTLLRLANEDADSKGSLKRVIKGLSGKNVAGVGVKMDPNTGKALHSL